MTLSRRHLFRVATLAAGAIGSAALVKYAPAQENSGQNATSGGKSPKESAGYQNQPNGDQRCSTCANFVAPSDCKVVIGPVSPAGWCHLYQAKSP